MFLVSFLACFFGGSGSIMLSTDANDALKPLAADVCGSNVSSQWVSSNGEYILFSQALFTVERREAYCSNRGGRAGENKFSTRVGSLSECVTHIQSVPECGIWFDYGSDGWCDCVRIVDGNCLPASWKNYSIYKFNDIQKDNCTIVATNPVERWSPMIGHIAGNVISMSGWDYVGKLSEDQESIHWNDTEMTVWTKMKAPPLQEGLAQVREMLQFAIETEQSVIQPYLAALYSLHPGSNINASSTLHDLVVEEMLHMTTASNILNAIGGHPKMNTQSFVPVYPTKLPFVNMTLSLTPFTPEQMDTFRHVEEATWGPDNTYRINTVAVYYFQIGMHLEALVNAYGERKVYNGNPSLQVVTGSSRGAIAPVRTHTDATKFLTGIYVQGEGNKGSLFETSLYNGQSELPHYYRFNELRKNRQYNFSNNTTQLEDPTGKSMGIDWNAVYKFTTNPKSKDFANHTEIYRKMLEFNSCYTHLLAGLHDTFNGNPEKFGQQIGNMMVIGKLAKNLMATPHPDHADMTVGPSWEWIDITGIDAPECPGLVSFV